MRVIYIAITIAISLGVTESARAECVDYAEFVHCLGSVVTPGLAVGVTHAGHYAYVVDQSNGLYVINVSDPAHPSCVGNVDTPSYACDVAVAGNYAYIADNFALR